METNLIVAMTDERVIGKDGSIPWRILEDMKLFRELTLNNTVIMGKNTWLSLPEKFRPLPNRTNIIVSSTLPEQVGAIICKDSQRAIEAANKQNKEIYCIGGARLYAAIMPSADVLHISWVKKQYGGDTYFPEVNFDEWEERETREFAEFTYKRYTKKDLKF